LEADVKTKIAQWQDNKGLIFTVYEDGSLDIFNPLTGEMSGDPSPNPRRAAALRADTSEQDRIQREGSIEDARRFGITSRQADRGLDQRADEIENSYRISLMQARTAQDAQRATAEYQQAQTQLARDRLAWDREYGSAQLGYNVLNMASQMRGADNYFQAANFARGVADDPRSNTFLTALQNNTRLRDFGAQSGTPNAYTIGSLSAKLGTPINGSTATGSNDANAAYLNQTHALGAAGAHKLGAGSLESLSEDELGLLKSGLEAPDEQGKAFNWSNFLGDYKRSRIGQGVAGSRAA
jgi:hypothetical protein